MIVIVGVYSALDLHFLKSETKLYSPSQNKMQNA